MVGNDDIYMSRDRPSADGRQRPILGCLAPKTIFQQRKDESIALFNEFNDPQSVNWAEITFLWY